MDTPEKEKFLETIRGLRKEAEEKLTGNRHYLAIQKLDEIAEAVELRPMSEEELGAVSEVLRGDQSDFAILEQQISSEVADPALADERPELADPVVATETDVDAGTDAEGNILPIWWKSEQVEPSDQQSETALISAEPVIEAPALPEVPEHEEVAVEGMADPEPVAEVEENAVDMASVVAGAALAGVAGAVIADQVSPEVSETVEMTEEIELIDVPEVEIAAPDVDLEAINIEAVAPDVEPSAGEMPVVEMPEPVEAPIVPDAPDILDVLDIPDALETADLGDIVVVPEIPETPEAIEAVEALIEFEAPVEVFADPEVSEAAPAAFVVDEINLADIEIVEPESIDTTASEQIASLLPDMGADVQAVAAAAAASAVVMGASVVGDTEPEAIPEMIENAPIEIVEPEAEQVVSEHIEAVAQSVPAIPAVKVLNADDLNQHPTYGANRGGFLKRFANSLRGKDYI